MTMANDWGKMHITFIEKERIQACVQKAIK